MCRYLALLVLLAIAAPPGGAVPLVNLGVAAGVAMQGDRDDSNEFVPWSVLGPPTCGAAITPFRLTLTAHTWTEGDVLTLHARSVRGVVSAATTGSPPSVTIEFLSTSTCAFFGVEGTKVAVADVYTVTGL